ncbi:helix-turn-helix domain-containing protein [Mesonia sp. HuA40]|uniref:helix-turn-helix domain-containing protein n=1 Tax=Mesonia sp. HuA40 TaxID=2602761 RepID=UPI0011CC4B5C|nr:helix-turn-helix domain-containing protein [Mesonia sp. HuA40]TXK73897.1 helix-turn-helix transcriptional regulator [Mesonia sp. HuA40]
MIEILENIKTIRKKLGYSHEYMAHMLDLSQVAYTKLESNKTKLTVERLYKIAEILDVEVGEILNLQPNNQFNQTNKDNTTGYLQQTANFYQENKEQSKKIILLYEQRIADKEFIIAEMKKSIEVLSSK